MHKIFNIGQLVLSIAFLSISCSVALVIPNSINLAGGAMGAIANGNGIQAFWGPNGYAVTSFGQGFDTQSTGQFGPNAGAVSNMIARMQLFPAVAGFF